MTYYKTKREKNKLGVMQGRLLPKYKGRYQAHPVDYWQQEFLLAKQYDLDLIEFILDYDGYEENPIMSSNGIDEIRKITEKTGVAVMSVCADYFMEAPLHGRSKSDILNSQKVLSQLISNCSKLGCTDIVIPCVDQSSLGQDLNVLRQFVENFLPGVEMAERQGINLALETDLAPEPFSALLEMLDSTAVTVNYDIGNSASLGYDPIEELKAYGARISDIHIKDRILHGGSVELGQGNAKFSVFFNELSKISYNGIFIMQAFRDDDGVQVFESQLKWIKQYLGPWIGD